MTLNFERTLFSFKRLSQNEILAIKPMRIRHKTVSSGDSVKKIAKQIPIEGFALEWFELLNAIKRETPLKPGQRIRTIAE